MPRNGGAVNILAEGRLDIAIAERLLQFCGHGRGTVDHARKTDLQRRIDGVNAAARSQRYFVLIDLDRLPPQNDVCAPQVVQEWVPNPSPRLCFRIAVNEIESWLLADRERLARFFELDTSALTPDPDDLDLPKEYLINKMRGSRNPDIVRDMVPTESSREGSRYFARLRAFVTDEVRGWRPEIAAESSDSLRRCLVRLRSLR